ncbi:MAG: DUF2103 domain-containing protein [bacterium]
MAKISNSKTTDSHSTLTDTAKEVLSIVSKFDEVSKIGIGFITHVRGGRRDIKFLPINGGLKAVVRGSGAVQELYIYTNESKTVIEKILKTFK